MPLSTNPFELRALQEFPLYYLHVPRTAGTTLSAALDAAFPPEAIFPVQLIDDLLAWDLDRLDGFALYRGHFGWILPRLLRHPVAVVTLVREPIAQTISHFRYMQRMPAHPHYAAIHERGLTLLDALYHPIIGRDLWNMQTRYLNYDLDLDHFARHPVAGDCLRAVAGEWDMSAERQEATLRTAVQGLKACTVVGLTEQLDATVALVASIFKLDKVGAVARLNADPQPVAADQLSPEVRTALQATTELDRQLYETARSLFERQLHRQLGQDAEPMVIKLAAGHVPVNNGGDEVRLFDDNRTGCGTPAPRRKWA